MRGNEVIYDLSLSIVHIMALARSSMNREDAIERDDLQAWFDRIRRESPTSAAKLCLNF
jgi:hypothetical protein